MAPILERRAQREPSKRLSPLRRTGRLALFGLSVSLGLMLILAFEFLPARYAFNEGEVSVYNVKSPERVTFVSQIKTQEAKIKAAGAVADIYVLDATVADSVLRRATEVLGSISTTRRSVAALEAKRDTIKNLADVSLSSAVADEILDLDEPSWQAVVTDTLRIVGKVMDGRVTTLQFNEVKAGIQTQVNPGFSDRQALMVSSLASGFIKPNYVVDSDATSRARRDAQDRVVPVQVTIEKGETILRDGDVVQALDIEKLQAVGLRNPALRWKDILASFLLPGLAVLVVVLYIHYFQQVVADDSRRLILLGILILLTALAAKLTVTGRDVNTYYTYLFPAAAASMLVAILLDVQLGVVITVLLAVVMGMLSTASFEMAILCLMGGGIGALALHRLERFTAIFTAGAFVSAANLATSVSFHLLAGEPDVQHIVILAFVSAINGMLAALLAFSAVYLFGHVFDITTALSMLELAHPSQPLFRRLLAEAPGTYHHSVVVANLAERAAEVIGADRLLCRIGAYYHDIGKVTRPYAFIENQMDGQNLHDQLDSAKSAQLVIAHVSDGLELARRYGVPGRVRDVIAQHHGTTLVQYFYHQACSGSEKPIEDAPFRYAGPRPQTREAGILMLADSVEAAVRASRDHSSETIAAIVGKIVQDRLADGQLDECNVTLRDLDRIKRVFTQVLQGIFHPRIEYPAQPPAALPAQGLARGRRGKGSGQA